jgi:hypothetical protein
MAQSDEGFGFNLQRRNELRGGIIFGVLEIEPYRWPGDEDLESLGDETHFGCGAELPAAGGSGRGASVSALSCWR